MAAGVLDRPGGSPVEPAFDRALERETLATFPRERLEAEITELAAHLTAAESRFLALVAEFDRREAWRDWECRSCAHWLSWQCGIELGAAREKVRVARALDDLPVTRDAFASGRLSYSKVRAVTRVANAASEEELVGVALSATAAHVERIVRACRRVVTQEEAAAEVEVVNHPHARRYLRWYWDDDGSLVVNGRLSPEDGALLVAAIEAHARTVPADDAPPPECRAAFHDARCSSEHLPPIARTRADALVALALAGTNGEPATTVDGVRAELSIHVGVEVLLGEAGGRCELDGGPALAVETVRRLACDAAVVAILDDPDGAPLHVGRRTRRVSTGLRRALHDRDRGCRFPGCGERRVVQRHHVEHHARGGKASLSNMVELCWFHHRSVHEGGVRLELHADGRVTASRPVGTTLEAIEPVIDPDDGGIEQHNRDLALPITPSTAIPAWAGEPLDLQHVVSAWLHNAGGPNEGALVIHDYPGVPLGHRANEGLIPPHDG